uniref:Uncharacterized protein n=1 Tax=Anguilla anguilla TaxID=7936 RepID=A0A0E9RNG9_ANGAN
MVRQRIWCTEQFLNKDPQLKHCGETGVSFNTSFFLNEAFIHTFFS